jgi:hypothetical protein
MDFKREWFLYEKNDTTFYALKEILETIEQGICDIYIIIKRPLA